MVDLPSVTFACETVTPLFLGGADPRGEPELRAPSLRGAMRYWFRALLGEPDPTKLSLREAKVFGGPQHERAEPQRASPLRVAVRWVQEPPIKKWGPPQWPPDTGGTGRNQVNGLVYLGFAFRATGGRDAQPARQAIDAGWRFTVELSARDAGVLRQACAAWWVLCHVGGLGSRTRRGFGTIRVLAVNGAAALGDGLPPMPLAARTPQALAAALSEGLRVAAAALGAGAPMPRPSYTTLRQGAAVACVLGHAWPSWHAALRDVGELMARIRRGMQPTMSTVLKPPSGQQLTFERPAFGLPIVYYNPQTRQSVTLEADSISRRASPLIIRPLRLADGQYAVLLVGSGAVFWPQHARLKADGRKLPGEVSQQGIRRFLEACHSQWHSTRVELP